MAAFIVAAMDYDPEGARCPHLAEGDAGVIEQVADHIRLQLAIALNASGSVGDFARQIGHVLQHAGPAADGVKGIAQFM